MDWAQTQRAAQQTETGYRVQAVRTGACWQYVAWGPLADPEAKYWDWHATHGREHYSRSQRVPERSPCLGVHQTASEARAACEAHRAREEGIG